MADNKSNWLHHTSQLLRPNQKLLGEVISWKSLRVVEVSLGPNQEITQTAKKKYWFWPDEWASLSVRTMVSTVGKSNWIAWMPAASWAPEASWSLGILEAGEGQWGRARLPVNWNGEGRVVAAATEEYPECLMIVGTVCPDTDEEVAPARWATRWRPSGQPELPNLEPGETLEYQGAAFLVGVLCVKGEGLGALWEDERENTLGWTPVHSMAQAMQQNGLERKWSFGPHPHWELIETAVRAVSGGPSGWEI